jgi:hypothetical protein
VITQIKGFAADSDVDFTLVPETNAERVLLKAMRGRAAEIVFSAGSDSLTFRAVVDGVRE